MSAPHGFRDCLQSPALLFRIPSVESTGSNRRVPAQEGHLLKDEDVLHTVFGGSCRRSDGRPEEMSAIEFHSASPLKSAHSMDFILEALRFGRLASW